MIHTNGQSGSRSNMHTLSNSTTTAVSSNHNTNNYLFDTSDLSTSDYHDTHSSWSNSNNNNNELEQNKRKRNGSFDSLETVEKPLPTSQSAATNAGDTQTLLSGFSNDNTNNGDQQDLVPDESLSSDPLRKPGRKPLSENVFEDDDEDPKAKRKVQNRAAQRAFRERKERYVRDLEMKIRQIQTNHLHTTAQLSQENQYLRSVIHRLKAEICQLKGLPMDHYNDGMPHMPNWHPQQQQQLLHSHTTSASSNSNSDLAPFLTMGSHAALAPAMARARPIAIAPAGTPPSPPHNNTKRSIAPAKRRPVPILPQKQEIKTPTDKTSTNNNNTLVQQQPQQIYLQNNNNNETYPSSSSSAFNASSQPALYVQFSPEEKPQDNFNIHHNNNHNASTADSYLSSDVTANLFMNDNNDDLMIFNNVSSAGLNNSNTTTSTTNNHSHHHHHHHNDHSGGSSSGSSSGSHGHRSPLLPHQQQTQSTSISTPTITTNTTTPTRIMPQKQDGAEKLVEEQETQQSRVQNVWRRLNLYGRFSDFDFDQLSRVAQMADHRGASQLPMSDGRVPLMEDWELDKLMLQIDSDHL